MGTIAEKWVEQGLQQGLQEGLQQGLLDGIELALEIRFSSEGLKLMPQIYRIQDLGRLRVVRNALRTAERLEDIRDLIRALGAPNEA